MERLKRDVAKQPLNFGSEPKIDAERKASPDTREKGSGMSNERFPMGFVVEYVKDRKSEREIYEPLPTAATIPIEKFLSSDNRDRVQPNPQADPLVAEFLTYFPTR